MRIILVKLHRLINEVKKEIKKRIFIFKLYFEFLQYFCIYTILFNIILVIFDFIFLQTHTFTQAVNLPT